MSRVVGIVAGAGVLAALAGFLLDLGQSPAPATCGPPPVAAAAVALAGGEPAPRGVTYAPAIAAAEASSARHASVSGAQVMDVHRGGGVASAQVLVSGRGPYGTYVVPQDLTFTCSGTEWVLDG